MKRYIHSFFLYSFFLISFSPLVHAENFFEVFYLGLQHDPLLRQSEAEYQIALQAYPIARAALLPQLSFSASRKRTHESIEGTTFGVANSSDTYFTEKYSINLTQSLYNRDYYVLLKQSKSTIAQALAKRDSMRQDLIIRTAVAYFDALEALDNLQFATSEKAAISKQLDEAKRRFSVGLTAITDIKEAEASYDLSVAREIDAKNQSDIIFEKLSLITGHQHNRLSPLSNNMSLSLPEPSDSQAWVDKATQYNLDLLAKMKELEVAEDEIEHQRADHYPTLDVVGSTSNTDKGGGVSGAIETDNNMIGIEFNIPLFAGGSTFYKTREAVYAREKVKEQLEQKRREVIQKTRDSYLNVSSGVSRVNALKRALESTEVAAQSTQAGFDVGTRSSVDVLLSLKDTYAAKRDYSRARYDYIIATLLLKQSIGALSQDDVELINAWLD